MFIVIFNEVFLSFLQSFPVTTLDETALYKAQNASPDIFKKKKKIANMQRLLCNSVPSQISFSFSSHLSPFLLSFLSSLLPSFLPQTYYVQM